jgi:translation initiation factor 2 beta subunit (eIF-2beta)/eIF-5
MKLFCWFLGHKNTISCVVDGRVMHDQCARCGAALPVAYPYNEIYRKLRG